MAKINKREMNYRIDFTTMTLTMTAEFADRAYDPNTDEYATLSYYGTEATYAIDENGFQERFDVAPEGCEGWLLYGADEIMDVSELMIAKGDSAALDRLEEAVRGRIDAQLAVFRSYGVDQKDLLEGATVLRRGGYLFYAVGRTADRWEDLFLSCVR